MSKAKELRDKSIDELKAVLLDSKKELFALINDLKQAKKLDKPHLIRETKKNIARIHTIVTEKNAQETTS